MLGLLGSVVKIIKLGFVFILFGVPFYLVKLVAYKKLVWSVTKVYEAERQLGRAIVHALQFSGPSFIKLGQILSTRPDITGEAISEELAKLQDRLSPFSFNEVKRALESEIHGAIQDNFKEINPVPIAAASIAQVHKAVTIDGETVAIKVLRPGIEKKFEQDIALFKFIAKVMLLLSPNASRLKPDEILKILSDTVRFELDLRYEAASADTIRENCAGDENIIIPKIYWQLTGKRVLTMEWVNGIPIHERDRLIEAGHDMHDISRKLAVTFFNQAYRDGFFHADLHPGNIFVTQSGDIALVDFGIIGILSQTDRLLMAEILYGFITRDYKRVAEIHFTCGYVPSNQDPVQFALACRSIGEPIIGLPVNRISLGKLLKQLFEVSATFDMALQTQLILLQKTMITIEGVGIKLYPEVNMWKLAEPWIKSWAKGNFGLRGKYKNLKRNASQIAEVFPAAFKKLDNIITLSEHYLLKKDPPQPKSVKMWVKELIFGIAVGALASIIIMYYC